MQSALGPRFRRGRRYLQCKEIPYWRQSGMPAGRVAEAVERVDPAEVDEVSPPELPLVVPPGVVVVVLALPDCVLVMSRTWFLALSQHLPWVTEPEGVVVVLVWAAAIPMPPAIIMAVAIMAIFVMAVSVLSA